MGPGPEPADAEEEGEEAEPEQLAAGRGQLLHAAAAAGQQLYQLHERPEQQHHPVRLWG